MHDVVILAIKGLAGGVLVVAFALLSQGLEPKRFAGLFSAAPAVALAGLTVTLLDKGPHDAHQSAAGMIAGGVGMAVYAAAVDRRHRRVDPGRRDRGRPAPGRMSAGSGEPTVRDRVEQRPEFSLDKVRETTARGLIIRFAAGAATSIASGLVTLGFGPPVGGILLGFPAIMAAVLAISTVVWAAAAMLGYVVLWWR